MFLWLSNYASVFRFEFYVSETIACCCSTNIDPTDKAVPGGILGTRTAGFLNSSGRFHTAEPWIEYSVFGGSHSLTLAL